MDTTTEQRRHPRHRVLGAILVTPNGHGHEAYLLDVSASGACVTLPSDWIPIAHAPLKILFMPDSDAPLVLRAHVARIAMDHLGIEFDDRQGEGVQQLFEVLGKPQ
jgi:PilZ domain.